MPYYIGLRRTIFWIIALVLIIAAGIISRALHTGSILIDKYAGDALYAAMFYAIFRLTAPNKNAAILAMALMTALEFFQLTLIPLHMLASPNLLVHVAARLLGTTFSWFDLAAYVIGIAAITLLDRIRNRYVR